MTCRWLEGFEQFNYGTLSLYQASGKTVISGGSIRSETLQPVGGIGNGTRSIAISTRTNDVSILRFGFSSAGGCLSWLTSRNFQATPNALLNQNMCSLRNSDGDNLVKILVDQTFENTGDYEGEIGFVVGNTKIFSNLPVSLLNWQRWTLVYETSGTNVTAVRFYVGAILEVDWAGSIDVGDAATDRVVIGGEGNNTLATTMFDSFTFWDDPADEFEAIKAHWVHGLPVNAPVATTQGDWSSFDGVTTPSGDISARVADSSTTRGALTFVPDSELVLGYGDLPVGLNIDQIFAVAIWVRGQGSADFPETEAYLKSGPNDGVSTQENSEAGVTLIQTYPLDPNGNVSWTESAVNSLTVGVKVHI